MTRLIVFFLLSMCLNSNIYTQNSTFLKRQIERAIAYENRYDSLKASGFIIGCIDHDSTWIFPIGQASDTQNQAFGANTYFQIGSLTQTFTAANVLFLVKQGILNYDSTVNTYLKPTQRFAAGDQITLLNLVTHTSGLPKFPDDWGEIEQEKEQPFGHYTERAFFDFLKRQDTTHWQTGHYLFSNLNYVLVGNILENVDEELWWQPFAKFGDVPLVHGYNLANKPVEPWQVASIFQSAVGGCTNMNQLLGFVQWQLNVDSLDKKGYLKEMQKPLFPTKTSKHTLVGNGLHIFNEKKHFPICMSSGATSGHSVALVFMPQTQTGVVVLSNNRAIQGGLAMAVLKVLNNNWKRRS
ncbi:MAG: beta-lactamase family protein [Saprospiraceae bacterium]|nr:beta-lactamase family protein [Saprospiraceae bacterium]